MPGLLAWLRPRRVRRVSVTSAPADVLVQAVAVLRHFGARVVRCDVEDGTLEARLSPGGRLMLSAAEDAVGSQVTVKTEGRDWQGVARTLETELARGGSA
jgi:hypothetical protein